MSKTLANQIIKPNKNLRLKCGSNCVVEEIYVQFKKLMMIFFSEGGLGPKDIMRNPKSYESCEIDELFSPDGPLSTPESRENLFDFFSLYKLTKEYIDETTGRIIVDFTILTADEVNDIMQYIEVIPMISLRDVLTEVCNFAISKRNISCSVFFSENRFFDRFAGGKKTSQKKKRAIIIASLELHGVIFVRSTANPDLRFEFVSEFNLEAFLDDVVQKLEVEFIEAIPESKTEVPIASVSGSGAENNKIFSNLVNFFSIPVLNFISKHCLSQIYFLNLLDYKKTALHKR